MVSVTNQLWCDFDVLHERERVLFVIVIVISNRLNFEVVSGTNQLDSDCVTLRVAYSIAPVLCFA